MTEREPHAHALRQLGHLAIGRELEDVEQARELALVPVIVEPAHEVDDLAAGHPRVEVLLLRDVTDEFFVSDSGARDGGAEDADGAGVGANDAHQHADGGGLACAVAAQKAVHFAGAHGQIEAVDRAHVAIGAHQGSRGEDGLHIDGV